MLIETASQCIKIEAQAVLALIPRLDREFVHVAELIMNCAGRVIVCGMGKSGHVGQKIAATLASTGTPAFFLHPAEAIHGDLGMVTSADVLLAISHSGESREILDILPAVKRIGATIVAMTGKRDSSLGKSALFVLDCSVEKEACPLGLAPTASTTAVLAFGDALAVALLRERGFTAEDFAGFHPGGALGKKLLLKVEDLMHCGNANPKVLSGCSVRDALFVVTAKGLGAVSVVDETGRLLGLITDGIIRRELEQGIDVLGLSVQELMAVNPITVLRHQMAVDALNIMESRQPTPITVMPVVDEDNLVVGMIHMTDLVKSGIV